MAFVIALLVLAVPRASLRDSPPIGQAPAGGDTWIAFEGTWSASGRRESIAIDATRTAAVIEFSGPVVLSKADGMGRGFSGAAISFDDGEGVSVGRAVWTDERGDRLFSRFRGEAVGTGRRVTGTITGGSGRYAGATGDYSFAWQYVIEPESGAIHGRTVGLTGRVRRGAQP